MGIRRIGCALFKWGGTVLCVLLVVAFGYSSRRDVSWTGEDLSAINLASGACGYYWIAPDVDVAHLEYRPEPGWSVARYYVAPPLKWWIEHSRGPLFVGVCVPLWMPFIVIAVPTVVLWSRDGLSISRAWPPVVRWATPSEPRKLTLLRIFGACVLHGVLTIVLSIACSMLFSFFFDRLGGGSLSRVVGATLDFAGLTLVYGTPAWGVLWAWLFTRWQNSLFRRASAAHCDRCGYSLIGNVSGRCPECGAVA
jgi:hypothetical protein